MSSGQIAELSAGIMQYAWLIPLLPVLAFVLIIFVTRRFRMPSAIVAMICLAGSFAIAVGVLMERLAHPELPPQVLNIDWLTAGTFTVHFGVLVDNLSAVMLVVVTLVALLVQIYSTGYMNHEPTFGFAKFFAYLSLFTASMLGLVLATNFVMIYMCWELVGLCSYLLIGFWYYKQSAADAAKKAFVVTRFGDIGFLLGIVMTFWLVRSVDFVGQGNALDAMANLVHTNPIGVATAAILIFCGAVGKSAQFPLHIWLPDAMEGPTPVSALIHAATMVAAGVYLVSRCFVMFAASPEASAVVGWIGAITAIMAASIGMVQNDIKRVMAYSTVSQLGYMFMALGVGTTSGFVAGNFHLFTHAFFKALLFLGCGSIIHAVNTNDMWKMGGIRRAMPITHITFLAGCLALSGIFPFAGFWSKDAILDAAIHSKTMQVPAILGYIAAFMTAFYVFRLYCVTFNGDYRGGDPTAPHDASLSGEHHESHGVDKEHEGGKPGEHTAAGSHGHEVGSMSEHLPHENPPNMWFPLVVLAIGATFLGFLNAEAFGIDKYSQFLLGGHEVPAEAGNPWPLLGMSLAIAIGGALVAIAMYGSNPERGEARLRSMLGPIYTLLEKKYYMDELWGWLAANTMFLGASIANWIDANIIDGLLIKGTGQVVYFIGNLLREEHSGKVQQYAMMILVAVCVIIIGVGVAEPNFVLSPIKLWQQMHGGGAPPVP
jgi:NADH-quinone oxidoreductase subunit L